MFVAGLELQAMYAATGQRIAGVDAYDLLSAVLAFCAGIALLARCGDLPLSKRGSRSRRIDDLLAWVAVLSIAVLLVHQGVTDGVCHGSCTVSLPGRR